MGTEVLLINYWAEGNKKGFEGWVEGGQEIQIKENRFFFFFKEEERNRVVNKKERTQID